MRSRSSSSRRPLKHHHHTASQALDEATSTVSLLSPDEVAQLQGLARHGVLAELLDVRHLLHLGGGELTRSSGGESERARAQPTALAFAAGARSYCGRAPTPPLLTALTMSMTVPSAVHTCSSGREGKRSSSARLSARAAAGSSRNDGSSSDGATQQAPDRPLLRARTASSNGWKEMAQCVKGSRLKLGPRRSPLYLQRGAVGFEQALMMAGDGRVAPRHGRRRQATAGSGQRESLDALGSPAGRSKPPPGSSQPLHRCCQLAGQGHSLLLLLPGAASRLPPLCRRSPAVLVSPL